MNNQCIRNVNVQAVVIAAPTVNMRNLESNYEHAFSDEVSSWHIKQEPPEVVA
jgi:hypothetical protein